MPRHRDDDERRFTAASPDERRFTAATPDERRFTAATPDERRFTAATPDERRFTADGWRQSATARGRRRDNARLRIAALAAKQFGRARYDQLLAAGASETTIRRWRRIGYLHRVLPRVYAVGYAARSIEGDLAAALLYAGPGAMLSAATAIWWLGLLKYPPQQIFVSTPRRIADLGNIVVQDRRRLERTWHRGLPVSTPSRAILDYAATGRFDRLRLVLANADYEGRLDVAELQRMMGRGVAGSAPLRQALAIHLPQLALTRSHYEILLLNLCERYGLPIPETNVLVRGWLVDAVWPARRIVVEVDGWQGHRTRAQLESDHRRDLELRQAGYIVLRYTGQQLEENPEAVAADLLVHLAGEL